MAATSALKAFQSRLLFGIKKILPSLRRVIIGRDKIAHDGKVGKLCAPSTPLTNRAQRPTPVRCKILAATTAEGVRSVREGVDTDVEQIISK
jgi:hypothetical protein